MINTLPLLSESSTSLAALVLALAVFVLLAAVLVLVFVPLTYLISLSLTEDFFSDTDFFDDGIVITPVNKNF